MRPVYSQKQISSALISLGPELGPPYSAVHCRIKLMETQKVPKKKDSVGWCRLLVRARGTMVKRIMITAAKVRKSTRSKMKKILPDRDEACELICGLVQNHCN